MCTNPSGFLVITYAFYITVPPCLNNLPNSAHGILLGNIVDTLQDFVGIRRWLEEDCWGKGMDTADSSEMMVLLLVVVQTADMVAEMDSEK